MLFSSAIAFVITGFQLRGDYKKDLSLLEYDLESIESVHIDSLTQSVWTADKEDLTKQLNGILNKPDVKFIKIVEQDGSETIVGEEITSNYIEKTVELYKEYKGEKVHIATLTVRATLDTVYSNLYSKAIDILFMNAIKTLLVSGFILFMIFRLFTRHLNSIADHLKDLDVSKIDKNLVLHRGEHNISEKDEIDIVVEGITSMQKRLNIAVQTLNEKNILYKRLLESSQAIPWEYNIAERRLTYVGPQAEKILGFPVETYFEDGFLESRVHEADKERVRATFEQLDSNIISESSMDYRMLNINNEPIWIRNFFQVANKDKQPHQLSGYMFNFTEQKNIEEEKEKTRNQLEKLVHERTKDLEATIKELEAFSYSVSHDLRSPLRAIEGYATILQDDYSTNLDEEANHYLQRIRTGCHTMSDLIDALLNLSKTSTKSLQVKSVDISQICLQVVSKLKETEPRKNIKVDIMPGLFVDADPIAIRILLENLVGNAWKYTRKNTHPHIEFGAVKNSSPTVYYVRDNGIGFDPNFSKHLFTPFQRLYNSTDFEGTGIGLATSRRIIIRHRGKIWAESDVDKGAAFYFSLASDEFSNPPNLSSIGVAE